MAGKKSRTSKVSMGGRQKANLQHEANRQARFARRAEAGKKYEYKPNPFDKKKDFENWHDEDLKRREKAKSSKLSYARLASIFAKLDNEIRTEKEKKKVQAELKKTGKESKKGL